MSEEYDSDIVHNIEKVKDIDQAIRRIQKEFIDTNLLYTMLDDLDEVPLSEEHDFHAWCSDFIRVFDYIRTRTWPHISDLKARCIQIEDHDEDEEENEREGK